MTRTKNNFDPISGIYDFLSFIVFGNKIKQSQILLLSHIKDHQKILIIGGGTGWIIEEIVKLKKVTDLDYLELSKGMIEQASSRIPQNELTKVTFIHGDEQEIGCQQKYDVIIGCYFFDMFEGRKLDTVVSKVAGALKSGGLLLVADFNITPSSPLQHRVLVKMMYLFFRILCNIEAKKLERVQPVLEKYFLKKEYSVSIAGNLIVSEVYRK
ncbi:MAG TPA: class I SAM-dependent methyltransferase [Cytophagaceae bacterium]|jgi:ubiquinone/menaquinone biosynthesis C-methylase UbiE|nr:class I SAM-dependent methyltransferase [Cytophagaceae bacterium]